MVRVRSALERRRRGGLIFRRGAHRLASQIATGPQSRITQINESLQFFTGSVVKTGLDADVTIMQESRSPGRKTLTIHRSLHNLDQSGEPRRSARRKTRSDAETRYPVASSKHIVRRNPSALPSHPAGKGLTPLPMGLGDSNIGREGAVCA
jgi:hypothetical protein